MKPKRDRVSTTQFALLGLLGLGPGSGYDLKQRAEASIGHFWSESYGQIYPTLKQLEAKGMAKCAVKTQAGKPDRRVYAITRAGSEALAAWLAQPPAGEPFRSPVLLKLFFGDRSAPEVSATHVARLRSEEIERLKHYDDVEKNIRKCYAKAAALPYWLATLSYGRHRSRAIVDWADETLRGLRSGRTK